MSIKQSTKKWIWVGVLMAVCLLLVRPISNMLFALRVGLSLRDLASGAAAQNMDVVQLKVSRQAGKWNYEALTYRPVKAPAKSAIVIVAGLSELGCYHPRLIALSKILAHEGIFVITPDIREFRDFQITAEPIDQILFWYREASRLDGGTKARKMGLAGISFSATLALMAAARPEICENVGFFVGIGPYFNLTRCTKGWFAADATAGTRSYYPTRFYAKWIVMRAALDMVGSDEDRIFLRRVLDNLILQNEVPAPDPNLSPEGARWYALATMKANQTDADLAAEIEQHLTYKIYPQLDPSEALENLRCPAFLVHGAYDDLIPPEESMDLHSRIPRSYLLISPFLTHTHPTEKQLPFRQKAAAAIDTAFFCYRLSEAVR